MDVRGKAIGRGRIRIVDTVETGDGETIQSARCYAGAALVFYVKPDIGGMKPSAVRRAFLRKCAELAVVVKPAEHATHADDGEETPSAYYCISPGGDAFARLSLHFTVKGYHVPVNARVPNGFAKPGEFGGAGGDAGARRTLAYARSSAAGKRALDERERRALLTAAQKARLDAEELAELPQ